MRFDIEIEGIEIKKNTLVLWDCERNMTTNCFHDAFCLFQNGKNLRLS